MPGVALAAGEDRGGSLIIVTDVSGGSVYLKKHAAFRLTAKIMTQSVTRNRLNHATALSAGSELLASTFATVCTRGLTLVVALGDLYETKILHFYE